LKYSPSFFSKSERLPFLDDEEEEEGDEEDEEEEDDDDAAPSFPELE